MSYNNYDTSQYNEPVYINIYDLHYINKLTWYLGFGIYHTGIQLYGTEYSYGCNSGINAIIPKTITNIPLRETIYLGSTNKSYSEIYNIIMDMKSIYTNDAYNILNNNCNNFCNDLSNKVLGTNIPNYINRLASLGNILPCVISSQNSITNNLIDNHHVL